MCGFVSSSITECSEWRFHADMSVGVPTVDPLFRHIPTGQVDA